MNLYLGCGPRPFHKQHLDVLGDDTWVFVDKFVHEEGIENWDATQLPIANESVDKIYNSHLLEHIPHIQVLEAIKHWYLKLKNGGRLILNVPDLGWACKQVLKYESGAPISGYYNTFSGEHGLLSIIYGSQSHDGEYHKSGFIDFQLEGLLKEAGFKIDKLWKEFDAHDMQVIRVEAEK